MRRSLPQTSRKRCQTFCDRAPTTADVFDVGSIVAGLRQSRDALRHRVDRFRARGQPAPAPASVRAAAGAAGWPGAGLRRRREAIVETLGQLTMALFPAHYGKLGNGNAAR